MIHNRRKVTLVVEVDDPVEIDDGIFETKLRHPSLQGELKFVHSQAGGRDEFLKAIDQNLVAGILDVAELVGGLIHGTRQKTQAKTNHGAVLHGPRPEGDIRGSDPSSKGIN